MRPPFGVSQSRASQTAGYIAAGILPWLTLELSRQSHILHNTPLALNFAIIAAIGTFFGFGPALTSVICTTLYFNYSTLPPFGHFSLGPTALAQSAIIFGLGMLLMLLTQSRRVAVKKMGMALASSQETTEALIQAQQGSNSAAWLFDTRSRQTSWYPGGTEIFGCSLDALTAMGSPTRLILPDDRPLVAAAAKRTEETGETFRVEFRVRWPNGEIHWLEACGIRVASDPKVWRGVTIDITDRKNTELALIRSEKLAAAGRLASAIAHELNNPLEAVMNLVYLAKINCQAEDIATTYLHDAEIELRRVAEVSTQTLRFHRQQSFPAKIDLAKTVLSLIDFYHRKLSALGIVTQLEVPQFLEMICRETELRQVLGTLIRNAIDAMPSGGTLRMRSRPCTDWRTGHEGVRITISDTGIGMPPQVRERIFEPFFTTKGDTGTGLSLWVATGIVERHGGYCRVRSTTNPSMRGSTFSIILPYVPSEN